MASSSPFAEAAASRQQKQPQPQQLQPQQQQQFQPQQQQLQPQQQQFQPQQQQQQFQPQQQQFQPQQQQFQPQQQQLQPQLQQQLQPQLQQQLQPQLQQQLQPQLQQQQFQTRAQSQLQLRQQPSVYPFYSQATQTAPWFQSAPMAWASPTPFGAVFQQRQQQQQHVVDASGLVAAIDSDRRRIDYERWQQQQGFFKALDDLASGRQQSTIVPIDQLRKRVLETDRYLTDERARRDRDVTADDMSRGPSIFAMSELQLIPLQRVNVVLASPASPISSIGTSTANTLLALSPPGAMNAVRAASPGRVLAMTNRPGDVGPMQFYPQDSPRVRLSTEQDNYFAGIAAMYTVIIGVVDVPSDSKLQPSMRPFDVDDDSIAVVEAMLECLLLWLSERGRNNIKPLFFTFPLHAAWMSIPLRLTIYGDVGRTDGNPHSLAGYLSAFSWRHSPDRRLAGEQVDDETIKMRADYQKFLAMLFSVMWRALMRRRLEQVGKPSAEFNRFLETALMNMSPQHMTVRVLEARILAIAARFQTAGEFFNTAKYIDGALKYRTIIDPNIGNFLAKYVYFSAP
jgi:hypothetical protein